MSWNEAAGSYRCNRKSRRGRGQRVLHRTGKQIFLVVRRLLGHLMLLLLFVVDSFALQYKVLYSLISLASFASWGYWYKYYFTTCSLYLQIKTLRFHRWSSLMPLLQFWASVPVYKSPIFIPDISWEDRLASVWVYYHVINSSLISNSGVAFFTL